jgi:hypothetical protein
MIIKGGLCMSSYLLGFTGVDFSLESLEGGNGDVLNKSVEFFSGFSIFVLLSGDSDSDSSGEISNTLAPDILVKSLVDSDVLID